MAKNQEEETNVPAVVGQEQLPEWAKPEDGAQLRGKENIDSKDLILPRIKLLQALSPEVQELKIGEAGLFCNSLTHEVYGEEVVFIPLTEYASRIKWASEELDGSIDCMSLDGKTGSRYGACSKCAFSEWKEPEEVKEGEDKKERKAPDCTRFLNFPALIVHSEGSLLGPVVVSFTRTSMKAGRQLASLVTQRPGDIFLFSYTLKAQQTKGPKGMYYLQAITAGDMVEKDQFFAAEQLYKQLSVTAYRAHEFDQTSEMGTGEKEDEKETPF